MGATSGVSHTNKSTTILGRTLDRSVPQQGTVQCRTLIALSHTLVLVFHLHWRAVLLLALILAATPRLHRAMLHRPWCHNNVSSCLALIAIHLLSLQRAFSSAFSLASSLAFRLNAVLPSAVSEVALLIFPADLCQHGAVSLHSSLVTIHLSSLWRAFSLVFSLSSSLVLLLGAVLPSAINSGDPLRP